MNAKTKMLEFLMDAIENSRKDGYILNDVNGFRIFANKNYAEVSFELGDGFIVKKTIFHADDEGE
jgi:hypothetical protein